MAAIVAGVFFSGGPSTFFRVWFSVLRGMSFNTRDNSVQLQKVACVLWGQEFCLLKVDLWVQDM